MLNHMSGSQFMFNPFRCDSSLNWFICWTIMERSEASLSCAGGSKSILTFPSPPNLPSSLLLLLHPKPPPWQPLRSILPRMVHNHHYHHRRTNHHDLLLRLVVLELRSLHYLIQCARCGYCCSRSDSRLLASTAAQAGAGYSNAIPPEYG